MLCELRVFLPQNSDPSGSMRSKATVCKGVKGAPKGEMDHPEYLQRGGGSPRIPPKGRWITQNTPTQVIDKMHMHMHNAVKAWGACF
jgi:hypothetical protein